jgi:hypothetical protein
MRRYAFPLILFTAIGAVVVIYVNARDEGPDKGREKSGPVEKPTTPAGSGESGTKSLLERGARGTPTPLERHKWLSELERVLARNDLSNAYFYRSKILEDIDTILADPTLYRNLMSAIRKYAADTDDVERRKLLLPMLRPIATDEATQLIEEQYYKALNSEERIVLLQAMADPRHSPETAVPWIVDVAINDEDENHRQQALDAVTDLHDHYDVIFDASHQIFESSTRPLQRSRALEAVSRSAHESKKAQEFVRERLRRPRAEELPMLLTSMDGWGSLEDAARLKAMATEYPEMAELLTDHATRMRRHRLAEMGEDPFADAEKVDK